MRKCYSCKEKLIDKSYGIGHGQHVCYSCFIDDLRERFYPYVSRSGTCIIYPYSINNKGYGRISVLGKAELAHRVSWFLTNGTWPRHTINHKCENRLCINIKHLEDVTYKEHTAFTLRNDKSFIFKKCKRGHDKTFYSIYTKAYPHGRWECKVCNTNRMARRGDL